MQKAKAKFLKVCIESTLKRANKPLTVSEIVFRIKRALANKNMPHKGLRINVNSNIVRALLIILRRENKIIYYPRYSNNNNLATYRINI